MIILGVVLAVLGFLLGISLLWILGIVLVVLGVVLVVIPAEVGGRPHWY
jgi:hypothetical protein